MDDTKREKMKRRSSPPNESYLFHPATRSDVHQAQPPTKDRPHCKVFLLDGQYFTIPVDKKAKGKVVINELFRHLELRDLQEREYFSVYYVDLTGSRIFLNPFKEIRKQLPNASSRTIWELFFGVQFYATKLTMLADEMTRYLYVLQICRDIKEKWIHADRSTKLQLTSLLVQANCGDYDSEEHKLGYVNPYIDMLYNPSEIPVGLSSSVVEVHKEKTGFKPSEADNAFFMIAKGLYKYGQQIFPVHDRLGQSGQIGASIVGLFFHKDGKEFMNIPWEDVVTVGHRKKKFRVRYHPKGSSDGVKHMLYLFCSEPSAKLVWRGCVEQHAFFRLERPTPLVKNTVKSFHSFKRNSELRFSRGRTMYQMLRNDHKQPEFQRSLPTLYPTQITDEPLRPDGLGPIRSLTVATPPAISKSESNILEESKFYMTVEITKSEPDLTRVVEFSATEKQKCSFTVTFKERTPSPTLLPNSIEEETVTAIAVDLEVLVCTPSPGPDEAMAEFFDPEQSKDIYDVDQEVDQEMHVDHEIHVDHDTNDVDCDWESDCDTQIDIESATDDETDSDHEIDYDHKIDHDTNVETDVDHETPEKVHDDPVAIPLSCMNQEPKTVQENEDALAEMKIFPFILKKKKKLENCSRIILFYVRFLTFYLFLFLLSTGYSFLDS